ncbi:MAG: phosphatase PAP2 family protein [Phycisphaerales bacterium]
MPREDNAPSQPALDPAAPKQSAHQPFSWSRPWIDVWRWVNTPDQRWWFWPLTIGLLAVIFLHPLDAWLAGLIPSGDKLPGDVRREWLALQQFGAISSIVIIAVIVWLQTPHLRARLCDALLAVGAAALTSWILKMLIGRVRPRFEDPDRFLGPFGSYPIVHSGGDKPVLMHAWEFWKRDAASLWSMPSNHTAAAVALAAALGAMYPRLRPLFYTLAAIVAAGRLVFDAHYLTDIIAGATVGLVVGTALTRWQWGSKLYDKLTGKPETRWLA